MTFVLLITGVGSLIHIYSIGYMAHDPERRRFFGYMNLFVAAMLLLVLADNYVLLYVGWEGVGLASYLLIGFWSVQAVGRGRGQEGVHVEPGRRRRPVARDLPDVQHVRHGHASPGCSPAPATWPTPGMLTAIALLLLLGACGKSGQFPLQAWLPDAMEGPTPVSALIHAATMVTAGRLPDRPVRPDLRPDRGRAAGR